MPAEPTAESPQIEMQINVERYKYILQQINSINENVHKVLALYQTLATAIAGAAVALFVGHKQWQLQAETAKGGVYALLWLQSLVAAFAVLLIVIGVLSWVDYRREECDLTDRIVYPGFRKRPSPRNWFRWTETYIVAFIAFSTAAIWLIASIFLVPAMT